MTNFETLMFGDIDDNPKLLNDTKMPLTSFSIFALMGWRGCGKTTK
jgi:ABC-type phosphate transport system ATPase subunit